MLFYFRPYLAHFPASSVRLLLADREFIGADWIKFLHDNSIPFAIRLREDLRVTTEDGCDLTLFARLRHAGRTQFFEARLGAREGTRAGAAPRYGTGSTPNTPPDGSRGASTGTPIAARSLRTIRL
jgi:hypothetical protein